MVRMPKARSLAPALGPIPLMRRTASGHTRVGSSAIVSTVKPSGLSISLAILASSLLGVTPIEQLRPVVRRTLLRISCASARTPPVASWPTASCAPGRSLRSM